MDLCHMVNSKGDKIERETTYLLALDGDVNFEAYDLELVLERVLNSLP